MKLDPGYNQHTDRDSSLDQPDLGQSDRSISVAKPDASAHVSVKTHLSDMQLSNSAAMGGSGSYGSRATVDNSAVSITNIPACEETTNGLSVAPNEPRKQPTVPTALSSSGASMFKECPRRWRFYYVDRLPDKPSKPALVGTFVHSVLEQLLHESPESRTVVRAKQLARTEWDSFRYNKAYLSLGLDEDQGRKFRWKAWKAIEGLWALEDPGSVKVRDIEVTVRSMLGEVPFRGVVDRIDIEPDGLVVTDYKSGLAPSQRAYPKRLRQVLLYSAAVAAHTGETPVRARLYYLGQKVVNTQVTEDNLADVVEGFTATWYDISAACESDVFEPRPSRFCNYCPYIKHCPEGKDDVARRAAEKEAAEESLDHFVECLFGG